MEKPLISVIVPVYKAEKYLQRCIDSVLQQTYQNLELILVDDGSPDNCGNICDEAALKDNRVKVIHKQNGGAASARNRGLDCASGDYIGFCDADDYVDCDMYEILLRVMIENDLDTIECTAKDMDEEGNLLNRGADDKKLKIQTSEETIKAIYLRKGNVSLAVRLTKSEIIKGIRIPEGRRVEDFYFTIILLMKVKFNCIYQYPFYNCVSHSDSVTRSATGSIYVDALYFYDKSVESLLNSGYQIKEEQSYYRYKMYYLFALSMTSDERKTYCSEIKKNKHDIRKNVWLIINMKYLKVKEKTILLLAGLSMTACRKIYLLKNGERYG